MKAYGLENELTVQLTDALVLRAPFSFQHCQYESFSSGTVDLSHLPVNRCPTVTATLDLNYTMKVPHTEGQLVFDVNENYVSKNLDTYSIAVPYEPYTQTYADARALLNASITYMGANDRWFVRAYGRNLTNKIYKESGQDVDPLWVWAFYGEPLFVGAEVGFKFSTK